MSLGETRDQKGMATAGTLSSSSGDARSLDLDGPVDYPFRPFPRSWLQRPVFEIFAETAAAHPDKTAIDDGETYLTYREVHDQALALAQRILTHVERGAPVGIALPNGATYPVAMLATLAAGCPYVPMDLSFPEARNALILRHAGMKAVIVDGTTREAVERMDPALTQIDFQASAGEDAASIPSASAEDVAFILYTSGSTGQPKGVYFNQSGLLHDTLRRTNVARVATEDRIALVFAPTVQAAQQEIYSSLLNGATLFVVDLRRKGFQEFVRVLRRGRITLCFSMPFVFRRIVDLCRDPKVFELIRHWQFAADRVFASDVELFRRHFPATSRFSVGVGSTEANLFCHWFIGHDRKLDQPMVPVGFVLPGYDIELVGDDGKPVPRGEVGEFIVSSPYVALGYWNDEVLTRRQFSISAHDPKARVFRTGDLGRMHPDGLLEMIGRKDRQIKVRGNRVEPAEIEGTIRNHPAVSDVAVIPRVDGERVELAAYVAVEQGQKLSDDELSAWLIGQLSDAMRPQFVYIVDQIPMLGNFKHDIPALTELDRKRREAEKTGQPDAVPVANSASDTAAASDPSVPNAVRAAWLRYFKPASFDKDITWDEAGGDSLKALEFVFLLEEALGRKVGMEILTPTTRPSELIARLQDGASEKSLAAEIAGGTRPLLFFLPGAYGVMLHHVRLVQALADECIVKFIDYPALDPATLAQIDVAKFFDNAVTGFIREIRAVAGDRPVRLLGHSFGAFSAYEIARRLAEEGHEVEFLGLLDVSPLMLIYAPVYLVGEALVPDGVTGSFVKRLLRSFVTGEFFRRATNRVLRLKFEGQLQRGRWTALAWEWRILQALRAKQLCSMLQSAASRYFRAKSIDRYQLKPYAGRMCLFRSADTPEWEKWKVPDDLGWGEYCSDVRIWEIPGDHSGFSLPENIGAARKAIADALKLCQAGAQGEVRSREAV